MARGTTHERVALVIAVLLALTLSIVSPSTAARPANHAPATSSAISPTFPTPIHHVIIVTMENEPANSVWSNGTYERQLAGQYADASNYFAICHPSAPNYLALTGGAPRQCGSDKYTTYNVDNVGNLLKQNGFTWAAYMESMPAPCYTTSDTTLYERHHNPFIYYKDIVGNSSYCKSHDLQFPALESAVNNTTFPNFAFISPNMYNDGHDTGVAGADKWLRNWLPSVMAAPWFSSTVVFITYDESLTSDTTGYSGAAGGHVFTIAVSPYTEDVRNYTNDTSHYNLLTTTEWLLGLGSTGYNDSAANYPPMTGLFNFGSRSTNTTISCAPLPLEAEKTTNCTATVTEEGGGPLTTPRGTVAWTDSPSGSGTFNSSALCALASTGVPGQAACGLGYVPGTSPPTVIAITGNYSGDTNDSASGAAYSTDATQSGTSTSFLCTSPLVVNEPSTCTTTITNSPSAGTAPTGTVTWTSTNLGGFNTTTCALSTLSSDSANCSVNYTSVSGGEGGHDIKASYAGDTDHSSSIEWETLTAQARADTTRVTCAPNPEVVNGATKCTATVTDTSPGTPITPDGTVSVTTSGLGKFNASSCVLSAATCSVMYTPTPGSVGTPHITATYGGDTDHPATQGAFDLTVAKRVTSTVVTCAPPFVNNQKIHCTITVTDESSGTALTPVGKITVKIHGPNDSTHYCTLAGSAGSATCKVVFEVAKTGSYTVTATYAGDPNESKSSDEISFAIS